MRWWRYFFGGAGKAVPTVTQQAEPPARPRSDSARRDRPDARPGRSRDRYGRESRGDRGDRPREAGRERPQGSECKAIVHGRHPASMAHAMVVAIGLRMKRGAKAQANDVRHRSRASDVGSRPVRAAMPRHRAVLHRRPHLASGAPTDAIAPRNERGPRPEGAGPEGQRGERGGRSRRGRRRRGRGRGEEGGAGDAAPATNRPVMTPALRAARLAATRSRRPRVRDRRKHVRNRNAASICQHLRDGGAGRDAAERPAAPAAPRPADTAAASGERFWRTSGDLVIQSTTDHQFVGRLGGRRAPRRMIVRSETQRAWSRRAFCVDSGFSSNP